VHCRFMRSRHIRAAPDRRARGAKEPEIEAGPDVGLVFVDPGERAYLSITARADTLRDPARARQIWKASDRSWWEGPSSTAAVVYELVKARLTGEKPDIGENRKATVGLQRRKLAAPRDGS
jgi:hypothetical protein